MMKRKKRTTEQFIEESIIVHNNKYDYSKVNLINMSSKVEIIHPTRGSFWQTPRNHLQGFNHKFNKTTEQFIKDAKNIHGNEYDYSKVDYIKAIEKVEIICLSHGSFFKTPNNHLSKKQGCPFCKNISKGELQIRKYLNNNNIKFIEQKTFPRCKYKQVLHFDFYLPIKNTCIEYDGRQHFIPIERFGGEKEFKKNQLRDNIKDDYCKENNINLLRIPYTEFNKIDDILQDRINDEYRNFIRRL